MSDENHDEVLSEFTTVTGIATDRAKFYLESANWNLQVTINIEIDVRNCKSVCNAQCGFISITFFSSFLFQIKKLK